MSADPAACAAWRYLETHAPLRPGEKATLFRFWMARDTYQAVSATQSLIFVHVALHYLITPGSSFYLLPMRQGRFLGADAEPTPICSASTERTSTLGDGITECTDTIGAKCRRPHGYRYWPNAKWRGRFCRPQNRPRPGWQSCSARPSSCLQSMMRCGTTVTRRRCVAILWRAHGWCSIERAPGAGAGERAAALASLLHDAAEELQQTPRDTRALPGALPHLLPPCPHPGEGRGASRSSLQHLPPPSEEWHRARGRLSVAARDRPRGKITKTG